MRKITIAIAFFQFGIFAQTKVDLKNQKDADFATFTSTRPMQTGTVVPATCAAGVMFFKTDATPGSNLYLCTSTNTFTQLVPGAGGGGNVSLTQGTSLPGTCTTPQLFFRTDLTFLYSCTATNTWTQIIGNGGNVSLTNGTSIPGTCTVPQLFYRTSTGFLYSCTATNTFTQVTGNVGTVVETQGTVIPATCTGNGQQVFYKTDTGILYVCTGVNTWSAVGNGGNVSITQGSAVPGTCTVPQLFFQTTTMFMWSCTATNVFTQVIGNGGTVIQTQGTSVPGTCLSQALFFNTATSVLYFCTATNVFTAVGAPVNLSGNSTTVLNDLKVVWTSVSQITIGVCSVPTPCTVRINGTTRTYTTAPTINIPGAYAAVGVVYIYLDPATGAITVGNGNAGVVSVTCSGCTLAAVTAFPYGAITLATASATGGAWDASGVVNFRAFQSSDYVTQGQGIIVTNSASGQVVSVDSTFVGLRVAVPSTSSTACSQGSYAVSASFIYQCWTTNTWVRAALVTF